MFPQAALRRLSGVEIGKLTRTIFVSLYCILNPSKNIQFGAFAKPG